MREQEELRGLVGASTLPTLEVDISDDDLPRVTEKIAEWMEQSGGLWANY